MPARYTYKCKNGLPCDFTTRQDPTTHEYLDYRIETHQICIYCGKKATFKKHNGRFHPTEYLDAHPREFCQRWGKYKQLYAQLYGLKKRDLAVKSTNNKKKEVNHYEYVSE